jgi:SAM-dependent methyltransferase
MKETSKASYRRRKDNERDWKPIFKGYGIDVGPGDDPLQCDDWADIEVVNLFDKEQGDANKIDEHFAQGVGQFDFIHGSQVMEHLHNPADFINRCLKLLNPSGWIVQSVPCYDHYEHRIFPSVHNADHKGTFSLWRKTRLNNSAKGYHIHVPTWIQQFDVSERYANLINTNYDYLAPDEKDQTWIMEDGVEAFIEILLRKRS